MEGFELTFGNDKIIAGVGKGHVLITVLHDAEIHITGNDDEKGLLLDWGKHALNEREKVKITKTESSHPDFPVGQQFKDRQEVMKEYMGLKTLLSEQGRTS